MRLHCQVKWPSAYFGQRGDGVAPASEAAVKVVGFSSVDLQDRVSPENGFDAISANQDGLSKLVETLKGLMPEPPRE